MIAKTVIISMLAAMVIMPKAAFAEVTMDDTLTELGFVSYKAVCNIITSSKQPSYTVFDVSDEKIEVVTKQINGAVVDKFEITDNAQ